MAKTKWRLQGLLGSWHKVASTKAFRLYRRINQFGEVWFFADYRIDNLVSRHHQLFPFEDGLEKSGRHANTVVLDLSRDELAKL